ncbi:LPS-assembly protein LptD [bacterium]|nr:LPS-assembly protein LptD [FCB group bacterium]MBL7191223.1 LPS-assembly protein LptD [bacterium]
MKYNYIKYIILTLLSLAAAVIAAEADSTFLPQSAPASSDTASIDIPAVSDSAAVDTVKKHRPSPKSSEIDTIITYSADSVFFSVKNRSTVLYKNAKVSYKDMTLTAGKITVDWDENKLIAEWIADTLWTDSLIMIPDSTSDDSAHIDTMIIIDKVIKKGHPQFRQKNDVIEGEFMIFNLKTKQGYVVEGATEYSEGSYFGEKIKRVEADVMNVADGYYTTCDEDTPHYSFRSKQMKLIVKDKVVAKPVVLYFERVPVAIIPFGIFPARSGRRSGVIIPTYGESSSQGRFFRHLGYYLAESDYWDVKSSLDFFEKYGIRFTGDLRYTKRYRLSGNLYGSYDRKLARYDMGYRHNQTITPTSQLRVDAYYVSDTNYIKDLNMNPIERMNRNIRSNAMFSKRFPNINASFSLNLNHQLNLDTEESTFTLPQASFSLSQRALFPAERTGEEQWFNKIYFSAGGNYTNRHQKTRHLSPPITVTEYDSTTGQDTTYQIQDYYFKRTVGAALKNNYTINSPQVIFKYINLNPSMSVSQDWTDKVYNYHYTTASDDADSLVSEREYGVFARHTASFSAGLTTKLYGMFPGLGNIQAFRHVLTPNISFRYTPDFSDKFLGYYQYILDSEGNEHKYDRFSGNAMIGGTPAKKAKSMNFSLDNLFQMKRVVMKGEEEVTEKLDLFSLTFSGSYDFMKDSQNWSNLSSRLRAQPLRNASLWAVNSMSLEVSATHSPYAYEGASTVDKYYFEGGNLAKGKLLRLLNLGVSSSISLASTSGAGGGGAPKTPARQADFAETTGDSAWNEFVGEYDRHYTSPEELWQPPAIPWSMNLSFSYSRSTPNPNVKTETFWLNGSLDLSLTQKWKLGYTARYDMKEGDLVSSGLSLYRDMHCWEGRFQWYPSGYGQGFFVKINVKASALRDLKIEKTKGVGGAYGY